MNISVSRTRVANGLIGIGHQAKDWRLNITKKEIIGGGSIKHKTSKNIKNASVGDLMKQQALADYLTQTQTLYKIFNLILRCLVLS